MEWKKIRQQASRNRTLGIQEKQSDICSWKWVEREQYNGVPPTSANVADPDEMNFS